MTTLRSRSRPHQGAGGPESAVVRGTPSPSLSLRPNLMPQTSPTLRVLTGQKEEQVQTFVAKWKKPHPEENIRKLDDSKYQSHSHVQERDEKDSDRASRRNDRCTTRRFVSDTKKQDGNKIELTKEDRDYDDRDELDAKTKDEMKMMKTRTSTWLDKDTLVLSEVNPEASKASMTATAAAVLIVKGFNVSFGSAVDTVSSIVSRRPTRKKQQKQEKISFTQVQDAMQHFFSHQSAAKEMGESKQIQDKQALESVFWSKCAILTATAVVMACSANNEVHLAQIAAEVVLTNYPQGCAEEEGDWQTSLASRLEEVTTEVYTNIMSLRGKYPAAATAASVSAGVILNERDSLDYKEKEEAAAEAAPASGTGMTVRNAEEQRKQEEITDEAERLRKEEKRLKDEEERAAVAAEAKRLEVEKLRQSEEQRKQEEAAEAEKDADTSSPKAQEKADYASTKKHLPVLRELADATKEDEETNEASVNAHKEVVIAETKEANDPPGEVRALINIQDELISEEAEKQLASASAETDDIAKEEEETNKLSDNAACKEDESNEPLVDLSNKENATNEKANVPIRAATNIAIVANATHEDNATAASTEAQEEAMYASVKEQLVAAFREAEDAEKEGEETREVSVDDPEEIVAAETREAIGPLGELTDEGKDEEQALTKNQDYPISEEKEKELSPAAGKADDVAKGQEERNERSTEVTEEDVSGEATKEAVALEAQYEAIAEKTEEQLAHGIDVAQADDAIACKAQDDVDAKETDEEPAPFAIESVLVAKEDLEDNELLTDFHEAIEEAKKLAAPTYTKMNEIVKKQSSEMKDQLQKTVQWFGLEPVSEALLTGAVAKEHKKEQTETKRLLFEEKMCEAEEEMAAAAGWLDAESEQKNREVEAEAKRKEENVREVKEVKELQRLEANHLKVHSPEKVEEKMRRDEVESADADEERIKEEKLRNAVQRMQRKHKKAAEEARAKRLEEDRKCKAREMREKIVAMGEEAVAVASDTNAVQRMQRKQKEAAEMARAKRLQLEEDIKYKAAETRETVVAAREEAVAVGFDTTSTPRAEFSREEMLREKVAVEVERLKAEERRKEIMEEAKQILEEKKMREAEEERAIAAAAAIAAEAKQRKAEELRKEKVAAVIKRILEEEHKAEEDSSATAAVAAGVAAAKTEQHDSKRMKKTFSMKKMLGLKK